MANSKNILILGDSWTQGELGLDHQGKNYVIHRGVEQYLLDAGHQVVNLGKLGASNSLAYHQYLQDPSPHDHDLILWFQTEVTRDVNWDYQNLFLKDFKELKSIRRTFDRIQMFWYQRMNTLAQQRNKKIHVMGGYITVDDKINAFPNLINFIPSVITLIDPEKNFSMYGFFSTFPWFLNLMENVKKEHWFDRETMEQILTEFVEIIEEHADIQRFMGENKKYFWPDGLHPNREGHRVIFKKIEILLNEI